MSATMTQEQKAVSAEFRMPFTAIGRRAYWYAGGDTGPSARPLLAFITGVGHRTVCLSVIRPDFNQFLCVDGVRHRSDPEAKEGEFEEYGCWAEFPLDHPELAQVPVSQAKAIEKK